jgi:hypothetical protein
MRAHDDEIATTLLCASCDFACGIPGHEQILYWDIGIGSGNMPMQVVHKPMLIRLRLALIRRFAISDILRPERFDDMKHQNRTLVLPSQINGDAKCVL